MRPVPGRSEVVSAVGEVVCELDVAPLSGQIAVGDPHAGDVPQWDTGEEAVVSNSQLVLVACRSDFDGPVKCVVWKHTDLPAWDEDVVFAGEVLLTTPDLFVGSLLSGAGATLQVGPGWHDVVVRAQPSGTASRIDVAVLPVVLDEEVD